MLKIYLKFYAKEKLMFEKLGIKHEMILSHKEIIVISAKLCRHFKFRQPEIRFYGNIDSGTFSPSYYWIRVSNRPSLGILIHELSHAYEADVFGKTKHTKRLMRLIKKLGNYCMKKNYWRKDDKIIQSSTNNPQSL